MEDGLSKPSLQSNIPEWGKMNKVNKSEKVTAATGNIVIKDDPSVFLKRLLIKFGSLVNEV